MRALFNQIITLPFMFVILSIGMSNFAKADEWQVEKMSGDVWVITDTPSKVALTKATKLKNGDKIRTGQRGRVLLKRNKETILVSPNSVIGLPKTPSANGKTIILQQAGEIFLDVEKRNVKHFEVSTPFLAAVVKGTRFSISVNEKSAQVNVQSGKVEVSEFKTGQFVLVKPGQSALIENQPLVNKSSVIKLSGKGKKEQIQQGQPRKQLVASLKLDSPHINERSKEKSKDQAKLKKKNKKALLSDTAKAERKAKKKQKALTRASQKQIKKSEKNLNSKTKTKRATKREKAKAKATKSQSLQLQKRQNKKAARKFAKASKKSKLQRTKKSRRKVRSKRRFRIGRALGHVKLNAHRSTKGLTKNIRHAALNRRKRNINNNKATYWAVVNGNHAKSISSSVTKNNKSVKRGNRTNNNIAIQNNSVSSSSSNGISNDNGGSNTVTSTASTLSSVASNNGNGNGNGNGNAYGHSNGNNGNGNAYGQWWANLIQHWRNRHGGGDDDDDD